MRKKWRDAHCEFPDYMVYFLCSIFDIFDYTPPESEELAPPILRGPKFHPLICH
jgi:hypothetical protein